MLCFCCVCHYVCLASSHSSSLCHLILFFKLCQNTQPWLLSKTTLVSHWLRASRVNFFYLEKTCYARDIPIHSPPLVLFKNHSSSNYLDWMWMYNELIPKLIQYDFWKVSAFNIDKVFFSYKKNWEISNFLAIIIFMSQYVNLLLQMLL